MATSATMRQVRVAGLNDVTVVDSPVPDAGPGQVRVAVTYAGICGSDTHAVAGHHPFLHPPYLPGHELCGVVDAVGVGVDSSLVGTRVVVRPNVECGTCVNCRAGRINACQQLAWIGCDSSGALAGGMASHVVAPSRNVLPLPDDVGDRAAALVECLATPVHAARIAGDLHGAQVAILGAGTIGILCLVAARAAGAATIVVTDLEPAKRERALRLGADAAVDAADPQFAPAVRRAYGDGYADAVFDCVATETSIRQAFGVLRHAGTLLVVGVPARAGIVALPEVQDRELRVQGCANYTEADMQTAIGIAAAGGLPTDQIVSAIFPVEQAAAAFAAAAEGSAGKILVAPRGAAS